MECLILLMLGSLGFIHRITVLYKVYVAGSSDFVLVAFRPIERNKTQCYLLALVCVLAEFPLGINIVVKSV